MNVQNNIPDDLGAIYARRFKGEEQYRNAVWHVLIDSFFQRYVSPSATVLDLGCGYGQFINQVRCTQKLAMDLNPKAADYLAGDVRLLQQDCSSPWPLEDASLDVVFTSNFFEHLPTKAALAATVAHIFRCLRPGGILIAMGPNIRYINGAYWDFWDHHLALTHLSLGELLEVSGFRVQRSEERFLPYTMVGKRRSPTFAIALYLRLPFLWRFFGHQFLVIATK